jgi:threonyl-tRNA synthetase
MENQKQLAILRHSVAHLLAHAIMELYPDTLLTIGPATEDGFFYDILPKQNFHEADLEPISKRMHEIVKRNLPITHEEMDKEQARKLFAHNRFKLELIDGIPGPTVGIARQGNFYDLCRGGHVASTGLLAHFKLQNLSGSYWRADRANQPLQRISGTAFFTAEELSEYERLRTEAQLYDHRRLGKQLDLFSFHDEGIGFPFYHPKGRTIFNTLIAFMRKQLEAQNYQEIATPIMLSDELWKQSGHYDHYKQNMYFCTIDEKTYAVRPMNCPGAILMYKERPRSYRDLPLRLSEFGLVHRFELSGVLHGLFRTRAFTQDDAHIFCMPDQIQHEIQLMIDLVYTTYKKFGFAITHVAVSTKPEKAMGSDVLWETATQALIDSLKAKQIQYTIKEGEGAFYGPKIEFLIQDSMKREWQCGTIQVDFFQPQNFELEYTASSGQKERPVMLHRAIYGSLERFIGILVEHYKGAFPFWLAPVQARILTITDSQKAYAKSLLAILKEHKIRVEIDETSDPIAGKIKAAQLDKIPWMLVIGKKEEEQKTVTVRYLDGKQEFGLTIDQVVQKAATENA